MEGGQLSSFFDPARHALVSDIIRRHSTRRTDVRDAALEGLDLSSARTVLDLGCGFGFMSEAIARRVAPNAEITGIETCPANEGPFLERVRATGRRARFLPLRIAARLDWPDRSFDMVVASYSLYFFPQVIPEVARVLAPSGLFLAVTHTERSCRELLLSTGLPVSDTRLIGNIREFSAENGSRLLAPWFAEIERIDIQNTLVFEPDGHGDLLEYLRFKLPLILLPGHPGGGLPGPIEDTIRASLSRQGRVAFSKDDAAFRCRSPRCP